MKLLLLHYVTTEHRGMTEELDNGVKGQKEQGSGEPKEEDVE